MMSVIGFRRNKVENGNFTVINARLLDRFGQTLYHPPLILSYEAIAFQPKPPLRARFFCCVALILQSLSVQVVVDVNHKQAACDNPVTSHSPYRYPSLLQAV
ncbi:TPA: hypothetical protein WGW95_000387 [Neisseria meningitidis]